MKDIATSLELTKGTLYLYFKTKEEVFLAIYSDEFKSLFRDIDQQLSNSKNTNSIEEFMNILITSTQSNETFLKLNSILHAVLEQNINEEKALVFKQMIQVQLLSTGQKIEAFFSNLNPGQGTELLMLIHQLQIGCFHATTRTPMSELLKSQPCMAFMELDFYTEFTKSVGLIVKAMAKQI